MFKSGSPEVKLAGERGLKLKLAGGGTKVTVML
jgi:hypothetical protein